MDNIVSFIESIEPNLSYEGSSGAIALIVESNENMLTIESCVDNAFVAAYAEADEAEKENKVVGYAKKAWDWIVTAIKNAIAKLKGLFFQAVRKAKTLYAQAMNKIRELLAKGVSTKEGGRGTVDVEWVKIRPALFNYINKFNNNGKSRIAFYKSRVDNKASGEAMEKVNAYDFVENALGISADEAKNLKNYLRSECLEPKTKITVSQEAVKNAFDADVMKTLNDLYKATLNVDQELLKWVTESRNKEGANKELISNVNKVQNAITGASAILFDAVFSVVAKGLHSVIKATLFAIKKTAGSYGSEKFNAAKDKVFGKKEEGKQESGDIVLL